MYQYVYSQPQYHTILIQYQALVIPAAYHSAKHAIAPGNGNLVALTDDPLLSDLDDDAQKGLLIISRGTAILLLGVYIAYLIFQLKTHAHLFISKRKDHEARGGENIQEVEEEPAQMSVVAASVGYVPCKNNPNFRSPVCSLLVVTITTSFVADFCEYLTIQFYLALNSNLRQWWLLSRRRQRDIIFQSRLSVSSFYPLS
jgi:Ca2+:H+ antiporter